MKQLSIILLVLLSISILNCSQPNQSAEYVDISDENLAEVIRTKLELLPHEPIPIKQLSELTELTIPAQQEIKNLKGLENATGLTKLQIYSNYEIRNLSPLANLTELRELSVFTNKVSNLKPLRNLSKLTVLSFQRNRISNLKPLEKLTNLEVLYISQNPISDLTPLKNLKNLKTLWLAENSKLRDISPIAELTQLTGLTLDKIEIKDLSPIAALKDLTTLRLNDNYINDITPLSELTNLTELHIYHNQVKDISPLAGLADLTTLHLHSSIHDITPLKGLTKLTQLMLYANYIKDITPLSGLTNLTELRLEDNQITDITPLEALTDLTLLWLYKNQISDINPLHGMTKLVSLDLYRNNIQDISPLTGMTELKGLFLGGNDITSIEPLRDLTQLTHLGLAYNSIEDISPIENFQLLEYLKLRQNPVRDFTPLEKLRQNIPDLHQPVPKHIRRTRSVRSVYERHETQAGLPAGAIARLGKGGINVMQFSPDGKKLAVGTDVGLKMYDVTTGNEIDVPSKIVAEVNALAFSQDSSMLACGGASNPVIQLWNLQNGTQLPSIPIPYEGRTNSRPIYSVSALAFSNNNAKLINVSGDGKVSHWDISTSSNTPMVDYYRYARSKVIAISTDGSNFANGLHDGKVQLWDSSKEKPLATFKGHSRGLGIFKIFKKKNSIRQQVDVTALAFSLDGELLASGSKDKTVRLWETKNRKSVQTFEGHTGWITSVAFSNDSNILASGDTSSNLRLWDTNSGEELKSLQGHRNTIVALTFAPDNKTLASGSADGTIRFWDVNDSEETSVFTTGHTESVMVGAFSSDSTTFTAAMFNGTVQKYDIKTLKELSSFVANKHNITDSVVLSPDASLYASQSVEKSVAFNMYGTKTDITYDANPDRSELSLWDLSTGEQLPAQQPAEDMVFSPNNKYVARITSDNVIVSDVRNGDEFFRYETNSNSVLFSPDSALLVTGSSFSDTSEVWNVKRKQKLASFSRNNRPIAFTPDGNILACTNNYDIALWDLSIPTEPLVIGSLDSAYTYKKVVTFSPDGTIWVEAHYLMDKWFCEAQIQLKESVTDNILLTLYGHTEPINALAFSPDGETLASGSEDGTVLLWDWDNILNDIRFNNRLTHDR